jgi:hypothetical protein
MSDMWDAPSGDPDTLDMFATGGAAGSSRMDSLIGQMDSSTGARFRALSELAASLVPQEDTYQSDSDDEDGPFAMRDKVDPARLEALLSDLTRNGATLAELFSQLTEGALHLACVLLLL